MTMYEVNYLPIKPCIHRFSHFEYYLKQKKTQHYKNSYLAVDVVRALTIVLRAEVAPMNAYIVLLIIEMRVIMYG